MDILAEKKAGSSFLLIVSKYDCTIYFIMHNAFFGSRNDRSI